MSTAPAKPKLAVFKFASCDGCQLSLLDAEERIAGGGRHHDRYRFCCLEDADASRQRAVQTWGWSRVR